ncbi:MULTISPECIES: toll/interleukin-1 receptor domain-containing protein [Enterobacteriaceae]|nr:MULTISPECIES: toll/interleukin-1 receptor domain-containing protein [Enterobacteriaceae]HCJ6299172.1 toll/interleukin-1 receptor domain-containing protein [Enterobacter hormaechei subsp. xiangfangensis]HCW7016581.1 toll/interleukin-1 receptor domain-containing protein [Citrobacter farmeri]EMZ93782.1 TIR domain protein [Escherichia coli 2722950]MCU3986975.1 toll/interleukin-1 receptor domain-containing protein [Enterobacter mori]HBA6240803.1 TIR domain-containing protein [Escherichia coli]
MDNSQNNTVFVSYSHDDIQHKEWVHGLIKKLKKYGIEIVSDMNFPLGGNLMYMMNQALSNSHKVLVICTDNYNNKANNALGGAGYESHIASAMIMANQNTTKFIPIIRNVKSENKTPTSLMGRAYLDMSDDKNFSSSFVSLVKELTGNDISREVSNERFEGHISTSYFDMRLKQSFPDAPINKLMKFDGKNAVDRLDFLFSDYKEFTNNAFIWWFRGADNAIHHYQRVDDTKIILDGCLYNISSISVYSAQAYYQSFIYFSIAPEKLTGLYPNLNVSQTIQEFGYAWEEYGIYAGNLIKSNDYYNGATLINGLPQKLNGEAVIITHYVSKYNFLLAAANSPYSSESLRRILPDLMNSILKGEYSLDFILNNILLKLPKRKD